MAKTKKIFNIIISGVGGQGLITLTQIIAEAAMIEGYDVKTSELHGLSQKGGGVGTHVRFGKKVYSPLISLGKADLILGLEILESLRAIPYANPETIFLLNKRSLSFLGSPSEKEIIRKLKSLVSPHTKRAPTPKFGGGERGQGTKGPLYIISASEICQQELGKEIVSGIYLLSYGVSKKLIPFKPNSILKAISKVVSKKYLELNKKAFNLARQNYD